VCSSEVVLPIPILPIHPSRHLVSLLPSLHHFILPPHANPLGSPPSIIGSLAGTSYWGPVAGHGLISRNLNLVRAERRRSEAERTELVVGDIEAVPAGEYGDKYVKIVKHHEEEGGGNEGVSESEGEVGADGKEEGDKE
jgi:hypothetical protein